MEPADSVILVHSWNMHDLLSEQIGIVLDRHSANHADLSVKQSVSGLRSLSAYLRLEALKESLLDLWHRAVWAGRSEVGQELSCLLLSGAALKEHSCVSCRLLLNTEGPIGFQSRVQEGDHGLSTLLSAPTPGGERAQWHSTGLQIPGQHSWSALMHWLLCCHCSLLLLNDLMLLSKLLLLRLKLLLHDHNLRGNLRRLMASRLSVLRTRLIHISVIPSRKGVQRMRNHGLLRMVRLRQPKNNRLFSSTERPAKQI